jgi:nucleoside-diphosphate-sugar epimerase
MAVDRVVAARFHTELDLIGIIVFNPSAFAGDISMRIFVTGAPGVIGSALVPELIQAGHQVVGLTRSEAGAGKLRAAGAEVLHGNIEDLDSGRREAANSDGVIHLAFNHDFSQFQKNAGNLLQACW